MNQISIEICSENLKPDPVSKICPELINYEYFIMWLETVAIEYSKLAITQ